jgi:hypothetical protein
MALLRRPLVPVRKALSRGHPRTVQTGSPSASTTATPWPMPGCCCPATLAHRRGIEQVVDELVDLGDRPSHHRPGGKVLTLLHAMMAGADGIDDADGLRTAQTALLLGHRVLAPSMLERSCVRSPSGTSASSTGSPRPSWVGREQPLPDPARRP